MQRFTQLINKEEDSGEFAAEALKVKDGFNKKFYNKATAQYSNNTVTANLLPLAFNIMPAADSNNIFKNITDKILIENKGHISTGVIGTQWLMRWLTTYGRADIAYRLANNTTYPSWGYMAENGATTIWELWNGNTANPAMNSQNHVMLLGDLLIWFYENLGGIQSDRDEPAFKKIIMKPSFVSELEYVNASYQSPYGRIGSFWKKSDGQLTWDISIPGNSKAIIHIPAANANDVKEGGRNASEAEGVKFLKMEDGRAVFQIGSGYYSFSVNK